MGAKKTQAAKPVEEKPVEKPAFEDKEGMVYEDPKKSEE